jgi:hypothetical protein
MKHLNYQIRYRDFKSDDGDLSLDAWSNGVGGLIVMIAVIYILFMLFMIFCHKPPPDTPQITAAMYELRDRTERRFSLKGWTWSIELPSGKVAIYKKGQWRRP